MAGRSISRAMGAQSLPRVLRRSAHGGSSGALRPGAAAVLPDEVVELKSSVATVVPEEDAAAHGRGDSYWTPDPDTGVFGPEDDRDRRRRSQNARGAGGSSVLKENAWIRHLEVEDAEKPDPAAAMD